MNAYFDFDVSYRRLAFFWLQMLKIKGVVGQDKGYLSEEAYLIILITWLLKQRFLTKAQLGVNQEDEKIIKKEKMPEAFMAKNSFSLSGP